MENEKSTLSPRKLGKRAFFQNTQPPVILRSSASSWNSGSFSRFMQVLAVGIFDPALRTAAECWDRGETKALARLGGRLLSLLAGIGLLSLLAARLWGRWALVLLYGESIAPYSGLLGPVVVCAVLFALCAPPRA